MRKLDPRTKLLLTALFTTMVFFVDVLIVAAIQMIFFIILCLTLRIPKEKIFSPFKAIVPLIALLIGFQMLWGQGLVSGLMLGCRIITLAVLLPIFIFTTDARQIALGFTRLQFNYRTAFIISSTLNLVPVFEEEARRILDARKLRMPARAGKKSVGFREYPAILLPLMIKIMRRSQMTSLVMDARAFGAYPTRTWPEELRFSTADFWAFTAGIALAASLMAATVLLKM